MKMIRGFPLSVFIICLTANIDSFAADVSPEAQRPPPSSQENRVKELPVLLGESVNLSHDAYQARIIAGGAPTKGPKPGQDLPDAPKGSTYAKPTEAMP